MPSIHLNSITLRNFRAFGDNSDPVKLAVPNGTRGSGLTVLVGENGSGKTTVLEAIELIVKNTFAARARIGVSDFNDKEKKIEVTARTTEPFEVKRLWGNNSFNSDGFYFFANIRSRDESARLLDPIALDISFTEPDGTNSGIQDVERRLGATGPYGTDRVPVRVSYFDKNRSRHLVGGKYQTKFDDVLGDMNFQFLKWIRSKSDAEKTQLATKATEASKTIHDSVNDKIVTDAFNKIAELIGDLDLKLDFANLQEPYSGAAIYSRVDDKLDQIPVNKLGSGIEMICSLVFLETIYKKTSESAIYCIDEPEMHLHPQLQDKLFSYLIELSKDKQVIISTHSPSFVSLDTLGTTIKLTALDGDISQATLSVATISKIKPNRNFFERHKTLLFADRAVFVEGADDLERYATFASNNGYAELVPHILMMNGKDPVRLYESICKELSIRFAAVVDEDFSYQLSTWDRQKVQRMLRRIKDTYPAFDLDDFNTQNRSTEVKTPKSGDDAPTELTVDSTTICKASEGNIFVLSSGEGSDYLSKEGIPLTDSCKDELKAILKAVSQAIAVTVE